MFSWIFARQPKVDTIEMTIDHDGHSWILSGNGLTIMAEKLEEMDRKLEAALRSRLESEGRLNVFMRSNNEVIPEWMRPYMNHYFNRCLELPLRY